jgi:hypothetical protein
MRNIINLALVAAFALSISAAIANPVSTTVVETKVVTKTEKPKPVVKAETVKSQTTTTTTTTKAAH